MVWKFQPDLATLSRMITEILLEVCDLNIATNMVLSRFSNGKPTELLDIVNEQPRPAATGKGDGMANARKTFSRFIFNDGNRAF